MKKEIFKIIENKDFINKKNIALKLGCELKECDKIDTALEELLISKEVATNFAGDFFINNDKDFVEGVISLNKKGFGFVSIEDEEEDIFVDRYNINTALHNDVVLIKRLKPKDKEKSEALDKKAEGVVVKVIKRKTEFVLAVVKQNRFKKSYLANLNNKLQNYFLESKTINEFTQNHLVKCKIETIDPKKQIIWVSLLEDFGDYSKPGNDVYAVLTEANVPLNFSDETLAQVEAITKDDVTGFDPSKSTRKDYRDHNFVTIDGDDSKDFDDAICVEKLKNNNYKLYVAIADVAHYVKEDSPLDVDAIKRGTSIYLINKVVPMLPEKISNDVCSLVPHENRFVMCCEMEINRKGETVNYEIFEGVINSKARLTYNQVNTYFKKNELNQDNNIKSLLDEAKVLHKILFDYKQKEGSIDFDLPEPKFVLDERGKISEILIRERGVSEQLIEAFMVRANETVAHFATKNKLPFLYRVHEQPKTEKLQALYQTLSLMGLNIQGQVNDVTSRDIQQSLYKLKENPNFNILAPLFLRSMEKAIYSDENLGHFGLASKHYSHFTSPIRRYPDLAIHRWLKTYVIEKNTSPKVIEKYKKLAIAYGENSSKTEQRAVECERDVIKMKQTEYMEKNVHKHFNGVISGVTSFGMFVSLSNLIEGLIRLTDIPGDYYIFDSKSFELRGENTNNRYRLGQKVRIKVKAASKILKQIDFLIATKRNVEDNYGDSKKQFNKNNRYKPKSKI